MDITAAEIEIVQVDLIEGGVSVLAKAWNATGEQIGFGKTGTVEIERFQIFNPPILVLDPSGTIERTYTDNSNPTESVKVTQYYREDPEQALLDVMKHTLKVKKLKFSDENMVIGSVGNTTSTFFSGSGDGFITSSSANWATARGATTGSANDTATETGSNAPRAILFSGTYYIGRFFTPFDTSALPDTDDIDSATYSMYQKTFGGTVATTLEAVQTSQASPTGLVSADYNNVTFTSGGSIAFPTATAEYKDIALNATGEGWINKTGWTYLGALGGSDLDNIAPSGFMRQGSMEMEEGTNAPKLVVEHSAGSSTSIKSLNGLAIASVKSRNGLAIASIKSINGLSNVS